MKLTTLCYLIKDGQWLMLYRNAGKQDGNEGKWIGVGGHFEEGESPEECMLREVREETGLTLTSHVFRGIVTFVSDCQETEYMFLYTAGGWKGTLGACDEGTLSWVPDAQVMNRPLWEGDRVFLRLLQTDAPFFSLKLVYHGEQLVEGILDGNPLAL